MQAVLLAGGKGTRLKPFTMVFPKPLVPLDDVPVIEVLVRQLAAHGIIDLTVVTGHLAELIRTFLGDGSQFGARIKYFRENTPLDTAGRPDDYALAVEQFRSDRRYFLPRRTAA